MGDPLTVSTKYQRHPPIVNNRDAQRAEPGEKPYQRKVPEAPNLVLRIQPSGTKSWKLTRDNHGKPRTLGRLPTMTYRMAVDTALRVLRGEEDKPEETEENKPLTFAAYIEGTYTDFAEQHHTRPKETVNVLKTFAFQKKKLDEIKLADVEKYRLKKMKDGLRNVSINRNCAILKASLERAVDWELIESNPLAKLKPLKTDKRKKVRFLSVDESKALHRALAARDERKRAERISANEWRRERGYELLPELGTYSDRVTPMVILALNTGMRRGELWNLTWGDINLEQRLLTVQGETDDGRRSKSRQTRHIPLNDAAVECLLTYKGEELCMPDTPVFGQHEFKKAWAKLLKDAKITNFRWHDTRHTFASRLVMAGVPLNTVRELLGHASLDMTLIYAHLAPNVLAEAVSKINLET